MKRIIIDSQSNSLLCGSALEQRYDQRGGLCQVGAGHLVLTMDPVDEDFLRYWEGLGFTLPELVAVGPGANGETLSERVLEHGGARRRLVEAAGSGDARLEFFCIEEPERRLSREVGIPAYCNFDISMPLAGKIAFKTLCRELGLETVPWVHAADPDALVREGERMLEDNGELLVKTDRGMGGVGCGGMARVDDIQGLRRAVDDLSGLGMALFLEKAIQPLGAEFSVHWEMGMDGAVKRVVLFDTIAENSSYRGTGFPMHSGLTLAERVRRDLVDALVPYLQRQGGRGFYCCDIVADEAGALYWNDFNPRKGASIYVHDMVRRLARARLGDRPAAFWHEGLRLPNCEGMSVLEVLGRLDGLFEPGDAPFVVLTNPGVVPFGRIDLTGVSVSSRELAREVFNRAAARLSA